MRRDKTQSTVQPLPIPVEKIERSILLIRGSPGHARHRFGRALWSQWQSVQPSHQTQQDRFPSDFMFRLTKEEKEEVVTICDHLRKLKFSPVLPAAFTEHGAIMAATVLNTERTIKASVFVVRAFVKLREMLGTQKEFARKLEDLERRFAEHDEKFRIVFQAIRELMQPTDVLPKHRIGFATSEGQ